VRSYLSHLKHTKKMAESNLLDTKTLSLGEILSNGKTYEVPFFQRDYSWDEDHWDDLWTDIKRVYEDGHAHYMGAVVFQRQEDKLFLIIDGQQRFTTISLLILAVIQKIKNLEENGVAPSQNRERMELLMAQFIGQKDPVSLRYGSKLRLNENNNGFYQNSLVQFRPPSSVIASKLNDSEKMLWKASQYFQKEIDLLFGYVPSGETLAKFLDHSIADRLKFIQIVVENELNAYTVFETLNARGVELTTTDLLKNYLFSLVAKGGGEIRVVKEQWKKITEIIGMKDFPVFLRHYLNTQHELVARDNVFKTVRSTVSDQPSVFDLLEKLTEYAHIYRGLGDANDDLWGNDKDINEHLTALRLFRVIQFKPLLMVAYKRFSREYFKAQLRDAVAICFRYNVIAKRNAKDMERAFNKAAMQVSKGELKNPSEVFQQILKNIYIPDADFQNDFSTHSINTNKDKKLVRYVLFKLERQMEGGGAYDFETNEGTIEHILPENFSPDWEPFFTEEQHEQNVFAIGNLTILEPKANRELGQKPYSEKLPIYQRSQYKISVEINAYEWIPKSIKERQNNLAKKAKNIWRVPY
jgi:hypothetical protein